MRLIVSFTPPTVTAAPFAPSTSVGVAVNETVRGVSWEQRDAAVGIDRLLAIGGHRRRDADLLRELGYDRIPRVSSALETLALV